MEKIVNMKPPRIAMGLLLLAAGLWHFSPTNTILHVPYKLIGTISVIGGFIIMMWAWWLFRRAKTAIRPTSDPSVFIISGVYKYTRNPMYLGMLLMLTGAAFFMGTVPPFFAPVAFFLTIDNFFIPYEEAKLSNAFETEYSRYMKITRRWL